MAELPRVTITFLFTDIEGSTRLWEQHPEAMSLALARHDALLRAAIETNKGYIFKTMGDAFCAAFAAADDALAAAVAAQRALYAEAWGEVGFLAARMALHTGTFQERGGDYFGPALNRVARLLAVGHGGQLLLSQAACDRVRDALPEGVSIWELGAHRLKDLQQPEHIFQLVHPNLPAEFPPLRSLEAIGCNLPAQVSSFVWQEREIADGRGVAVFLEGLAREEGVGSQAERAARLFGAAAALRVALGTPRPPAEYEDYESHVAATGEQLGAEGFAVAWADGWAMTQAQAIAYALKERDPS
jgi:class 3 adenylate cyclase